MFREERTPWRLPLNGFKAGTEALDCMAASDAFEGAGVVKAERGAADGEGVERV